MRYVLFNICLILSFYCKAQPVPDCDKIRTNKRIFVKSQQDLIVDLRVGNASPHGINKDTNCFKIGYYDIKDSLGKIFFDFKIYKTSSDFSDDVWEDKDVPNMRIYIYGLNLKDITNHYNNDTFTYYIEIPEFLEGEYWIDVSNCKDVVPIRCFMCKDSIDALNINLLYNEEYLRKLKK